MLNRTAQHLRLTIMIFDATLWPSRDLILLLPATWTAGSNGFLSIHQERLQSMKLCSFARVWVPATRRRLHGSCFRSTIRRQVSAQFWKTAVYWKTKLSRFLVENPDKQHHHMMHFLSVQHWQCHSPLDSDCAPNFRTVDAYEVALTFSDSVHQGDRRKKSQQCFLTLTCIEMLVK